MQRMTGYHRVAKNMVLYSLSKGIEVIAGIFVLALLTRYLGDDSYGKFAFVMNLVFVFVPLINFGLSGIVIREIARDKGHSDEVFGTAMAVRTIFVLVSAGGVIIVAYQFSGISMLMVALAIISEFVLGYLRLASDLFIGYERMEYDCLVTITNKVLLLLVIILAVHNNLGLIGIFASMAAVNLISALFGFGVVLKKFLTPRITFETAPLKSLLKAAYPLAFSFLISELLFRFDIFVLKILANYSEVAFFDAPLRLILRLSSLALAFVISLHPVYSRLAHASRADLLYLYEKSFQALFAFILPVSIFTTLFAQRISVVLFGAQFVEAATSLQFLIWVLFILFFDILSGHILISLNKQKLIALEFVVCFIINVILEIVLVPRYGHVGASSSKLVAFSIGFLLLFYLLSRELGSISIFSIAKKPSISSLIAIGGLWLIKDHELPLLLLVGIPLYIGCLYGLKIFPHEDVIRLKEILKKS